MNNKTLKFVFWGTPEVASETLEILKKNGYLPELIVTAPDRPKGRKMLLTPPPVKVWAIENNIPYIQPEKIEGKNVWDVLGTLGKEGADVVFRNIAQADEPSIVIRQQADMRVEKNNNRPELFVVVAYGQILPEEILNMPKFGSINIHYSLLPKHRGASPVESAILAGDELTGVSIQKMEYKMDAGPIIAKEEIDILPTEKAGELRGRLIKLGGELLVKILPGFLDSKIILTSQDESLATHCKKIKKEDGLIDPDGDAIKNYNKFRAYATWPRTFFFKDGKRIIITDAKLENSKFVIKKIIPENGKETKY